MRTFIAIIALGFTCSASYAQTATDLYTNKDYPGLVKLEGNADALTAEELYMVGYAFFQLENDAKAIAFYDKAIAKGLDDGAIHFYKGLSLRYAEQYDKALAEFDLSLQREPDNQKFMTEKGLVYYRQRDLDKALAVFMEAQELQNTYYQPFYWAAGVLHEQQLFDQALRAYYLALDSIPLTNEYYPQALAGIGQLEYSFTKNYPRSAKAYGEAIALVPSNYVLYPKLMKAYNAAKEYAKADSVFALMKAAYERNELGEDEMKFKSTAICEFEWQGQKLVVYRSFVEPKETLDILYKVHMLNKEGDKVERVFMTEQTIVLEENGAKHLLCEKNKKTGGHITYPYGWAMDHIPLEDLQRAIVLVLDGKMKYSASSNFDK